MKEFSGQAWSVYETTEFAHLHHAIIDKLQALDSAGKTSKTHFFHARYENIYIDTELLPDITPILNCAREQAAHLLELDPEHLSMSFWFNIMNPGDVTTLHSHDDFDELLSGTYYLKASSDDASLVLHTKQGLIKLEPQAGRFVFFDPALPHEVSTQRPEAQRVSIGFNFGINNAARTSA